MQKYININSLCFCVLFFTALTFLTTPVGRNITNFVAAQQTEIYGGIKYLDYPYNLRGVGYKLVAYYLHTASIIFADYKNTFT